MLWHGMLPSDDPVAPICRGLLRAVDDGELEAYASTLSMVELPKVIRPQLPVERLVALTEQLRASRIIWVPLDEAIALHAREVGLERGLAPAYDAVILATAIYVGASNLYTHDRDDFRWARSSMAYAFSHPCFRHILLSSSSRSSSRGAHGAGRLPASEVMPDRPNALVIRMFSRWPR